MKRRFQIIRNGKKNQSRYTNKLLGQCKGWGGSIKNQKLLIIIMSKPGLTKQIVGVESSYCRDIYKVNVIANSQLFNLVMIGVKKGLQTFQYCLVERLPLICCLAHNLGTPKENSFSFKSNL